MLHVRPLEEDLNWVPTTARGVALGPRNTAVHCSCGRVRATLRLCEAHREVSAGSMTSGSEGRRRVAHRGSCERSNNTLQETSSQRYNMTRQRGRFRASHILCTIGNGPPPGSQIPKMRGWSLGEVASSPHSTQSLRGWARSAGLVISVMDHHPSNSTVTRLTKTQFGL